MSYMPEPRELFEQHTSELTLYVNTQVQWSRDIILQLSGSVLRGLLFIDTKALHESNQGDIRDVWVKSEIGTSTASLTGMGDGCFSFMLECASTNIEPEESTERMRVLIPVPEDFDEDDPGAIQEMPDPEEVY